MHVAVFWWSSLSFVEPGQFNMNHEVYYKGGFPVLAETTGSELASTRKLAEQFFVIGWVWQFNEHTPNWSFKLRQLNKVITITLRLTQHANMFLSTYLIVVFRRLSV